ncbi:disintegrin and metalloproteinase domain-containing protein 10-like isoform X1 [Centruroides sculpturatus]|uniref:disintegrin and metalloproteinase domain-containing protein 10-like isoform X1 n=2 Tax=Centruroides sculpturatus TaxID=218467 RepID=UPI000C6D1E0F|nr:disintegrin and metalloproteinase domain-containing protein 10-like isoform X1 [Centruroides sculpturatus]
MDRNVLFILLELIAFVNFAKCDSMTTDSYEIKNITRTNIVVTSDDAKNIKYFQFFLKTKMLNLFTLEDVGVFSSAAKIFIHGEKTIKKMHLKNMAKLSIRKGYIRKDYFTVNEEINAYGYSLNNEFTGRFQYENETYYIEPEYFHTKKKSFRQEDNIVYRLKDVIFKFTYQDDKISCDDVIEEEPFQPLVYDLSFIHISHNFMKHRNNRRSCSLELFADHTYFEYMNKDHQQIVSEMIFYAMNADFIFRNTDIDEDGQPDGIGFNIEKITIFENERHLFYPLRKFKTKDAKRFLENLAQYSHPYCMMICFTNRDFSTPSTCTIGRMNKIGGICFNDSQDSVSRSNVAFVTIRQNSKLIPRVKVAANLVHILGHAFGCQHDSENNNFCSSANDTENGNFIMHPEIPFGTLSNNWKFSSCCRKTMKEVIEKKDDCLKIMQKSVCGNGIVEEGESCDCNFDTGECEEVKNCCNIKGSPLQCTLQKDKECTPGVEECCDKSCRISNEVNRTCVSGESCFKAFGTCDEDSPFCPGLPESDGTPCFGTSRTCLKGKCISNICEDHNLKVCECSSPDWECHICCQSSPKICQSAKTLNFFTSKYELYLKKAGSPCDNNYGTCSSDGICKSRRGFSVWYYVSLLPFVILFCIVIILIPRRQKMRTSIENLTTRIQKITKKKANKPKKKKVFNLNIKKKKSPKL